jgi:hypothetical protein
MLLTQQVTLVERLRTWWNIKCRVLIEEIDRLQVDFQDLTRHYREILNARNVVDTRLNIENEVGVLDVLISLCPGPHTSPASRLIRVHAASVQLAVLVLDDVDVVVGELRALLTNIRRSEQLGHVFNSIPYS